MVFQCPTELFSVKKKNCKENTPENEHDIGKSSIYNRKMTSAKNNCIHQKLVTKPRLEPLRSKKLNDKAPQKSKGQMSSPRSTWGDTVDGRNPAPVDMV